ncbi:MAG: response regulator [Acidobacteria bacterium]|nr:response regulator [Acidobacteriota bacterium]
MGTRKLRTFVTLFCALAPAAWPASRIFAVRPISVNEGLSQSHVTSIVQDKQGFLWIGTAVGLNRYDGRRFRQYRSRPGDPSSLSASEIYAIHASAQGQVWVATAKGLDLYDPASDSFRQFPGISPPGLTSFLQPRSLDSTPDGKIWIALANGADPSVSLLAQLDPASSSIRHFPIPAPPMSQLVHVRVIDSRHIVAIHRDDANSTQPFGFTVDLLDPVSGQTARFAPKLPSAIPLTDGGGRDTSTALASPGSLWIGVPGNRVFLFNSRDGTIQPHIYSQELARSADPNLVSHVTAGVHGEVWVIPSWIRPGRRALVNSLYQLLPGSRSFERHSLRPEGACDLSRNFLISSVIDSTGVLWGGLSGAGACIADLESGMFARFHDASLDTPLNNNFVRSLWKTPDGVLWVATLVGISRINRARATVHSLRHNPADPSSLSDDEVRAILVDRSNYLWVATQHGGLNRAPLNSSVFQHFRHSPSRPLSISEDYLTSLYEDRDGAIWIGSGKTGLNRFNPATSDFQHYRNRPGDPTSVSSDHITALFQDSSGAFWVGTANAGLNRFHPASGRFSSVPLGGFPASNIVSIAEHPKLPGVLWIATMQQGILRFVPATGEVRAFNSENSLLPSNTVYSVLADDQNSVWAGTNVGLVRIRVDSGEFRLFGIDQGLQSMEFNTRACFRAADGELLLGGVGGANAFYPNAITQNSFPAKVVITAVRALDRKAKPGADPYVTVFRNDGSTPFGHLVSDRRELVFDFIALHFSDPTRNIYRFRLDGLDAGWREAGNVPEVTYTNLTPGTYAFRVQAATSRGIWSPTEAVYHFTIAKPFYETSWFLVLCAASLSALVFTAYRLRLRALSAKQAGLEREVRQRTGELTQALSVIGNQADLLRESGELKSRFITNISHDFRTPLSVTLGLLENLRDGLFGPVTEQMAGELEILLRNQRKLLRLVSQLLAVARIDSGKLQISAARLDLSALARDTTNLFQPVARQRRIALHCLAPHPVFAHADAGWIEQVLSNLILNALKFSPEDSQVLVDCSLHSPSGRPLLSVQDHGPGIAPQDLPRVFDRYYQAELGATMPHAGIGVGLSLAKEIVELHGGEIEVSSDPGAGTLFRVFLSPAGDAPANLPPPSASPLFDISTWASDVAAEHSPSLPVSASPPDESADRPTIVLAEDDPDLRSLLAQQLGRVYRVLPAAAGAEAWALVQSEIPDLVVSDIMMPEIDGLELCRSIRSSDETSFIPVILLTARASTADRLLGLEQGAIDYLAKPFDTAELLLRIRNLLEHGARLHARLAGLAAAHSTKTFDSLPESGDTVFLRRVYDRIRECAGDQDFSVEQLARHLAVSRMHLYRKLRAIVNKSPADLLMEYRLERAAQLLAVNAGNVSEIAYGLGFKSVSHFTRRFRLQYGCAPSQYRARRDQIHDSP